MTNDATPDTAPETAAPAAQSESAEPAAQPESAAPQAAPAPEAAPTSQAPEWIATIASGYQTDGPALGLGPAVFDGTVYPEAIVRIPLSTLNRHGLVAGATGTGKTKTLQVMAEQLSLHGVPTFIADIKGDVSGVASPGESNDKILARTAALGQKWNPTAYPTEFFSLGGQGKGIPMRATVSDFGPTLLSKVLGLNATQESSLGLIFHFADSKGWLLLDIKDLTAVIQYLLSDEGKAELKGLGGLSSATAGVILRNLIAFTDQGADVFFGEPQFQTADLLRLAPDGRGLINVLELPAVGDKPALFSTFLMWLLADLFQEMPEVGDLDKPKLVFFFDEAHLLFNGASKAFLASIEQTVKLIRSKGIGIFFVTQVPKDVPANVLAQLGSRVQHAMRAFTPDDAKALKATVSTFPHSDYDLSKLLTELGTGEAVVTVLSEKGAPTPVAWTRIIAPQSLMAPSPDATIDAVVAASQLAPKYRDTVDRESAYEILSGRATAGAQAVTDPAAPATPAAPAQPAAPRASTSKKEPKPEPSALDEVLNSAPMKSAMRSAGTVIGRELSRTIFGTLLRK